MEDQFAELRDLVLAALERDGLEAQLQYVAEHCADVPGLRVQLEDMLRAHHQTGGFLASRAEPPPTLDEPMVEEPGSVIEPYKLLQEIGHGGMGVAYMVEQTGPVERRVALKIIKPGILFDEPFVGQGKRRILGEHLFAMPAAETHASGQEDLDDELLELEVEHADAELPAGAVVSGEVRTDKAAGTDLALAGKGFIFDGVVVVRDFAADIAHDTPP